MHRTYSRKKTDGITYIQDPKIKRKKKMYSLKITLDFKRSLYFFFSIMENTILLLLVSIITNICLQRIFWLNYSF